MQSTIIVEGFRLSPQQRRLWLLQQDAMLAESAFGARLVLLLEGELQADTLCAGLEMACQRHESLRTTFRRLPGVLLPVQSVADSFECSWRSVDLRGDLRGDPGELAAPEQASEVQELPALESRGRFDFEEGPLVQATLYALARDRHLLSINLPALCADRRTLSNLFAEVCRCYGAGVDSGRVDDEQFQYSQFSEWQNTISEEAEALEGKEYWSKQDLAVASAIALPGQLRAADSPAEFAEVKLQLTPETTALVSAIAEQYETTNATVLLAAWQTLLWRLTGEPVVVGNMCDGRSYELLHDAFGLFARALPVRCEFTDSLRFGEVVSQIDSYQRETAEWQDYFEWEQSTEDAPKYFSFGFEYAVRSAARSESGLQISVHVQDCCAERFNLKLTCVGTERGLELEFQYDTAAFREDDIRRLGGQFQVLLSGAVRNPETLIAEFEIITAAERQQLLFEWNQTARDYPLEQCLHELFEQQVARTPDRPAVVFRDRQLTFAELNRRANQLAHYLRAQGVGPEVPVGLCVEPSLEMLVGLLGILKAGGAYLSIDPRNPRERINQVLRDTGTSLLLTRENLATGEFEGTTQLIRLDADWDEKIAAESDENSQSEASADNLAYIIYTSGSTGQPKGVMIQHRSAANLAAALREEIYAGLGPELKVGLNAPLAFDASVKQLLQLLSGHTLHLLPEELRLDAVRLLAYLDQHALDALDCTPSQLRLLLAAGLDKPGQSAPKLMLIGGEALDESLWSLLAANQRTRFFNVYGPTECTVDATWIAVQNAPALQTMPTIGRPIPNAQVYILDKNLQPVAIHMTGELYVGGNGVARGYLNAPELTAEKFVPDGLSGAGGGRLYRTGDLARYLRDGSIEFLGRNDSQVKIRGHRIELGEIESVLRQHEKVRQAVVVAHAGANGDVRLVAYVVAEAGETVEGQELRRLVSERLPDYMAPSFVEVIDELPLTRNGKVDLNALPAPGAARPSTAEPHVAPRNEIEQEITRVWKEVLQVERIGVHDNFFDAGGHSLLMVQVHNKLGEIFGKEISIVEMFAKPTISALAEYLGETNGSKPKFQKVMARAERRKQAAANRRRSQ
jgi:amino acid adenylation domain-containing protein